MDDKSHTLLPFTVHGCPIAHAVDLIGDRWILLILRSIFFGNCCFDRIQQDIGISRTVLSHRLKSLVAGGILERQVYKQRKKRSQAAYALTRYGQGFKIIFSALMQWGEEAVQQDPRLREKRLFLTKLYDADSHESLTLRFVTESGQCLHDTDNIRIRITRCQNERSVPKYSK